MKYIDLSKGKKAIVDDGDFEWLSQWKWHYITNGYAARRKEGPGNKKILMHRLILGTPKNKVTDHINGNRLDNRRQNLRNCSQSQNHHNTKINPLKNLGFKGISFNPRFKKWAAYIRCKGKKYYLGSFQNPLHAAMAYDIFAKDLQGEFANLNFKQ